MLQLHIAATAAAGPWSKDQPVAKLAKLLSGAGGGTKKKQNQANGQIKGRKVRAFKREELS